MTDTAPQHPAFDTVRTSGGVTEYRLKANGLTVLVLPQAAAPVVAFQITYRVGSRNERAGLTGATHLLEHLMFKGSERYNKDLGTSVFQVLQRVGARVNATTWYDRTNYYSVLPSEHLELAMAVEADRMRGARVRDEDLASERTVVLNELDRGENEPLRKLLHAVYATAFFAHPYGHPTIGWRSDVETVTAEGLRHFYDTFYWPSRATATIVGDVEPQRALDLVAEHFAAIPPGPEAGGDGAEPLADVSERDEDAVTREPPQIGERRVVVRQAGQLGAVLVAYKAPPALDPRADALEVLATSLSGGKSSRLYRALTDAGLTTHVSAFYPRLRDPGLFMVYAMLTPGTDPDAVEATIRETLKGVVDEGLSAEELARAKRQTLAAEAFGRDGAGAIVAQLNEAIAAGDWTLYTTALDRVEAVTLDDVQRAAADLVDDDQATVGHYVPVPGEPGP